MSGELKAYTPHEKLAKDVCFAMAMAYGAHDVCVTYCQGFGWCVECACSVDGCADQVRAILGNSKAAKVNWL